MSADVELSGIIINVDGTLETITVLLDGGEEVLVDFSSTTVITFSDTSSATFGDFAVDQMVHVVGTLNVDNTVDATSVEIQIVEEAA